MHICELPQNIFCHEWQIDGEMGTSEDQVVVGSLDINQTAVLPNELIGSRPEV